MDLGDICLQQRGFLDPWKIFFGDSGLEYGAICGHKNHPKWAISRYFGHDILEIPLAILHPLTGEEQ